VPPIYFVRFFRPLARKHNFTFFILALSVKIVELYCRAETGAAGSFGRVSAPEELFFFSLLQSFSFLPFRSRFLFRRSGFYF
jgi:hypothetical protein